MAELIVAVDKNYGIGYEGKLPWHCKEELALFKSKTMGKTLVMGRKTFESLPNKNLPGREILVLTRNKGPASCDPLVGVKTIRKINQVCDIPNWRNTVVFAGGASVYRNAIRKGLVKTVHLSEMKGEYTCDTHFDKNLLIFDYVTTNTTEHQDFTHHTLELTKNGEGQYLRLLNKVLTEGDSRVGRNGSVISSFNHNMTFDLRNNVFPLLTTKKMFFRGIIEELLFFLRGDTDTKKLEEKGVNIWRGNTSREFLDSLGMIDRKEGVMGPMYGYQWKNFDAEYDERTMSAKEPGVDQLKYVIDTIKKDPFSRRILMTTYNPRQAHEGVLYPCHSLMIQFYCNDDTYLDMYCFNRSSDSFLGQPFNIASSSVLHMIIAKLTNRVPRYFHLALGDTHIYENHIEAVKTQLARIPYRFPTIEIPDIKSFDDIPTLTSSQFKVSGYTSHPAIKAEMSA
jgi:thymidylate synthase